MARKFASAVLGCLMLELPGWAVEFSVTKLIGFEHVEPGTIEFPASGVRTSGDGVFFRGIGPYGLELFSTDGFSLTSFDINPDGHSLPGMFVEFQDRFHFAAFNSSGDAAQYEWYASDGKSVWPLPDIDPNTSTDPQLPFVYDGKLFYSGRGPNGRELYFFDGRSVEQVADLNPGPAHAWPNIISGVQVNGKMILAANTGESERYLFALEGTDVRQLSEQTLCPWPLTGERSTVAGGDMYFKVAYRVGDDCSYWLSRTGGETVEDIIQYDVLNGPIRSEPIDLRAVGDTLYFTAVGEVTFEPDLGHRNIIQLFRVRGSDVEVVDNDGDKDFGPSGLTLAGDKLFFEAHPFFSTIQSRRRRLAVLDDNGIHFVEMPPGYVPDPDPLFEHDGWIYFSGISRDGVHLFKTDGDTLKRIPGGTVPDLFPSSFTSTPDGLFVDGGTGLMGTDGESLHATAPWDELWATWGRVYFEGALYTYGRDDEGFGFFKVIRSDSLRRIDLNRNGQLDAEDLDLFSRRLRSPEPGPALDLNDDGRFDREDRRVAVEEIGKTYFGDSNLDGDFNSADLVLVFQHGRYEDDVADNASWAAGDWNGDGDFTTADFVLAFSSGGYNRGPRTLANSVPEPTAVALFAAGIFFVCGQCRRKGT